jgi:hypothetical protein
VTGTSIEGTTFRRCESRLCAWRDRSRQAVLPSASRLCRNGTSTKTSRLQRGIYTMRPRTIFPPFAMPGILSDCALRTANTDSAAIEPPAAERISIRGTGAVACLPPLHARCLAKSCGRRATASRARLREWRCTLQPSAPTRCWAGPLKGTLCAASRRASRGNL